MRSFQLICFLLLFLWIKADSDPKIYNVQKVTTFGESSFPMFSPDGRFLLFASKSTKYGTSCTRVYQLDLNNLNNEPISLYSSGLGYETRPTLYYRYHANVNSVLSTSVGVLNQLYKDANASFTSDYGCPKSKCDGQIDADLQKACSLNPLRRVEHYDYSTNLRCDYNGNLDKETDWDLKSPNSWINPEVKFSNNQKIFTGSCDTGECIYLQKGSTVIKASFNKDTSAFDGLSYNPDNNFNLNDVFFFHGYTTKEDWILKSIKKGVTPIVNSKIYRATYDQLYLNEEPDHFFKDGDKLSYLWPQSTNDPNKVLATGIDPNNQRSSVYLLELGKDPVRLTDPNYDSYHGILDPTNKYIAFVSKRGSEDPSIYIGKFLDSNIPDPQFNTTKPDASGYRVSNSIQNCICYNNPNNKSNTRHYWWTKMSSDGKLMYAGKTYTDTCSQIYIVDTDKNDTSVARKISSGFHFYSSPNFINGTDNILYASTLLQKYDKDQFPPNSCHDMVCEWNNPKLKTDKILKDLCDKVVVERGLWKSTELYISNKYGAIQKRLTFNNVFDGEAAVSLDGKTVVYSSENGDYNLYQMNIDGTNKKQITNNPGFEGGVSFSSDGKLIAYYATRPKTPLELADYYEMAKYEFTDIAKNQLYVYSFDTKKEYQITNFTDKIIQSSAFIQVDVDKDKYQLIFILYPHPPRKTLDLPEMHIATFKTPTGFSLNADVVENLNAYIWDININGDKLAFSQNGDICIVNDFKLDVSNGIKLNASIVLMFSSLLLAKFM